MISSFVIWVFIGYIFGSIPFAVIIAKTRGIDIFKVGSGNPGATNVMRSVGKWEGRLCFIFDALKGFIPVLIALLLPKDPMLASSSLVGALLGHSFSFWIKFRGGKGVATMVGGLLALCPAVMGVGMVLWLFVFFISGYVSLASIVMAFWLPFGGMIFNTAFVPLIVISLVGALVLIRHWANIGRLIKGTENKFGKK